VYVKFDIEKRDKNPNKGILVKINENKNQNNHFDVKCKNLKIKYIHNLLKVKVKQK